MKQIIYFFTTTILLNSCCTPDGHNGASNNIEESIERYVFLGEYIVPQNPYKINDTISIYVKEAWLEKTWKHGTRRSDTYPMDEYQICINTDSNSIKGIDKNYWSIGVDYDMCLRSSSYTSLIGDFKRIPTNDTLIYPVQKGDIKFNDTSIVIGTFILIRKK